MPHIIISYRRADSDAISGRIRDRLANHFGENSVFMDIDSIPFGIDFREHIQEALEQNDILVAVIGPRWLGPGKGGSFRIAEDTDPVRIEIETALKKGSAVIPVLVSGARMPKPSDLPDSLKDFSYRNAAEVDAGRDFHLHVERLIRSMDRILERKSKAASGETSIEADKLAAGVPVSDLKPVRADRPIQVPEAGAPAGSATPVAAIAAQAAPLPSTPLAAAAAAAPPPPVPAAKPARSYRVPVLTALALCLLAGIGAGTWLYFGGQKPASPPVAASQPTIAQPQTVVRPAGTASAGCKLDTPAVFTDDFQRLDPGWLLSADTTSHADGQLALNALEGKNNRVLYPPLRFKDVTLCATIRSPTQIAALDGDADAGVIFWATDASNFYNAAIFPNGSYSVYRMASGSWVQVAPRTPSPSIKPGVGAVNDIQVTTKDNVGTLYINGAKVQEFRGQPPKDGSMIGLYGASNSGERNEWRVQHVAVADPEQPKVQATASAPAPQVGPGCKPLRRAAFEDDFKSVDPGWGIVANTPASYSEGEVVLKPNLNKTWRQLYPSLFFRNATVCLTIKSPAKVNKLDGLTNGGLAFWAANRNNHYTAALYPDGRFDMYRLVNSEWAKLLPPTKAPSIKTGLGAVNEMVVTFSGNMAALYVNSQKLFEFRGQPPESGGSIGLFAASEADAENEWRFLQVTVVEKD